MAAAVIAAALSSWVGGCDAEPWQPDGEGVDWKEVFANTPRSIPAGPGSIVPDVSDTMNDAVVSWVEPSQGEDMQALYIGRTLLERRTQVVEKPNLFVNWADFPHVLALCDANLVITWLERTPGDAEGYGVRWARSTDGGVTWSEVGSLHDHAGPGEHGFVSLARLDERRAVATWLDGRNAVHGQEHGSEHGQKHGAGSMSLRAREIAIDGTLGPERVLDERVCDCCQTDVALASDGSWLVAYRDRSDTEVRDVKVVRVGGERVAEVFDSADGWQIHGCPVNGPAITTLGEKVALVWFSVGPDARGRVLCALSDDDGRTFDRRLALDEDNPLGRVDTVFATLGASHVYVAWLASRDGKAVWQGARFDHENLEHGVARAEIAPADSGRPSGFIRLAPLKHEIYCTFVEDGEPARVALRIFGWHIP